MPLHHNLYRPDPVEEHFRNLVRRNPTDQTLKGVFADWLEEHRGCLDIEIVCLRNPQMDLRTEWLRFLNR